MGGGSSVSEGTLEADTAEAALIKGVESAISQAINRSMDAHPEWRQTLPAVSEVLQLIAKDVSVTAEKQVEEKAAAALERPAAEAAAAATFSAIDADKSGKLDLEELLSALAAAGDVADRAEVEALFKRLDANGDGAITMEEWRAGHSGGGLRARLDAAMKRGQLSLPPPDEDDEPEPEGKDEDGVPLAAKQAAKAIRELDPPDPAHPDDRLAAAGYAEQYSLNYGNWGVSPWYGQPYEHMSPSDSDDETEEIEDKRRRNEDRGGGGRGASPRWMRSARPRYAGRRERSSSWRRTMQSSSGRSST